MGIDILTILSPHRPFAFVQEPASGPGLEQTLPDSRLHHTLPSGRLHHTLPDGWLHHTITEEDV